MAKDWWAGRPKHTPDHTLHFTGRGNKSDGIESKDLGENGKLLVKDYNLGLWRFYWHCEQCQWYFVEYSSAPGRYRPYTEAWESDLDVMCRGCTTGNKALVPPEKRRVEDAFYLD